MSALHLTSEALETLWPRVAERVRTDARTYQSLLANHIEADGEAVRICVAACDLAWDAGGLTVIVPVGAGVICYRIADAIADAVNAELGTCVPFAMHG